MTAIDDPPVTKVPDPVVPTIRYVARIDSTNDELMREPLRAAPQSPHVLWAGEQSAGRGRRGRSWISRAGDSAIFSVALERPCSEGAPVLTGFSLAVGVALAEALSGFGCQVGLKWPNDLWRAGCKVGGVLIETRRDRQVERIVVGVGLNLLSPGPLAGPGAGEPIVHPSPPGGLFDPPAATAPVAQIVARCAEAIVAAYGLFVTQGFAAFRERWVRLDALQGAPVQLFDGVNLLAAGEAAGVGDSGELRLRTPQGIRIFVIGDVSLRPAPRPK